MKKNRKNNKGEYKYAKALDFIQKQGYTASRWVCMDVSGTECPAHCPLEKFCHMKPERQLSDKEFEEWKEARNQAEEQTALKFIQDYLDGKDVYANIG